MNVVRHDSIWSTLFWTFHAWWKGYSIPTHPEFWTVTTELIDNDERYERALDNVVRAWTHLAPFFASYGYQLYEYRASHKDTLPPASSVFPPAVEETTYPYGRRMPGMNDNNDFAFYAIKGFRVWAARDAIGREVIIKLISLPGQDSEEAQIYRRLNTPDARLNPRNHTLPILEWIRYNDMTFVVTPRWGRCLGPKFETAEQLLDYGETMLEALEFLHENRIAHRDITTGNTVVNLIQKRGNAPGGRHPAETRYALIDFGASSIYAMDTDINNVICERDMRIGLAYVGLPPGRSNPFKDDVLVLLEMLQSYIRGLEEGIPQISTFFEQNMHDLDHPPAVAQVLRQFRDLRSELTKDQLAQAPPTRPVWRPSKTKA